ncbi:MAG: hypothetical protein ACUVX9_03355 [Anaerolineae bacterium]
MTAGLPQPFPVLALEEEDHNPGIRLFGKRFFGDQSALELLAELLAVAFSPKRLGKGQTLGEPLPSLPALAAWPDGVGLEYRPALRLNLKLFGLLTASRPDTRHPSHEEHYEVLRRRLQARIQIADGEAGEVVEWLEDVWRGFQGAGANRVWSAQTFFPVCSALLSKEAIWQYKAAKQKVPTTWLDVTANPAAYFSSRRAFLARGGELLYLQLCNALRQPAAAVQALAEELSAAADVGWTEDEQQPARLHQSLQQGLARLQQQGAGLDRLALLIEDLDPETTRAVNRMEAENSGWLTCAWCPAESWREGYLFAVELNRLLSATLAPVERLEMLVVACALQALRSLCAQSARYAPQPMEGGGPLGYAWLLSAPQGAPPALRQASRHNLQAVQALIQGALRRPALQEHARAGKKPAASLYREADNKYGHKLFLSLGKKLGLIVPKQGRYARLTVTDSILRYLVLALLSPGERCTEDEFRRRLFCHHGIAIEGPELAKAAAWSGLPASGTLQQGASGWLKASLQAGGFLHALSDACSVVRNTYAESEDERAGDMA